MSATDENFASAPEAVEFYNQCTSRGFDPAQVAHTQFLIAPKNRVNAPYLTATDLETFTVHAGPGIPVVPAFDTKGRRFGAFLGIGVDSSGDTVAPSSFTAFDIEAPGFLGEIERFVSYTAGRYVFVLDCAVAKRLYLDPVGHLSTVYCSRLKRAASSLSLALDRDITDNPIFEPDDIALGRLGPGEEFGYILGHTRDVEVKFALPSHYLDLVSFTLTRHWPSTDSFPELDPDDYDNLTHEMVDRQRSILRAITAAHPSILPVSGGSDSRKLLACISDRGENIAQYFCFEHTRYARLDALCGEYITTKIGLPFVRYSDRNVPSRRFDRRQINRKFWIRASWVAPPPNEFLFGMTDRTPKDHLHLRGNVMDLMRAIWWRQFPRRHRKAERGIAPEIGALFLASAPDENLIEKWTEPYLDWKNALPENAQDLVFDFIFLELFLHVSSAKYYGYDGNFYICPFSDRKLIESTLRFPVDYRFSGALNERFLEIADPRLSDQPYRGGIRDMIASGAYTPPS